MRRVAVLLSLVALAAGCGGDGSSSTTGPTTTLPPPDCPEPIAVDEAGDLVDALAALPWQGVGGYTSGVLPVTPDLVVRGTVVLEASQLPVPADCRERRDCSPQGGFWVDSVAGAAGEGDAGLTCLPAASRLTISDATVRLRPMLRDTHPCIFNFVPVVQVEPPCGTPCDAGQALCPADGVCYGVGAPFCLACEGGAKEACACRGSEGPLAEGARCAYWESGDVECVGACRDGVCAVGSCP